MKSITNWSVIDLASVALLAISGAAAFVSVLAAIRVDPLPAPMAASLSFSALLEQELETSTVDLDAAVRLNPFRPDRKSSVQRYRSPEAEPEPEADRRPLPEFHLLGVATRPGAPGLAAVALAGEQPRVVRVGQEVADFRLTQVGRASARLVGPDTTIVLRLYADALEGSAP